MFYSMLLLGLITLGFSVASISIARQEWRGSWKGHDIVVRNYLTNEQLYIDGKLIAEGKSSGLAFSQTLPGIIHHGDQIVPVLATIHPARMGLMVGAQVRIDGEAIVLERAPLGTFSLENKAAEAPPQDRRWIAVQQLLADIRTHGHDTEPIIQQIEVRLRDVFHEIGSFSARMEAHQALDDACNHDGTSALIALRDRHEEEARTLIAALQQLHLAVLEGQRSSQLEALHSLQAQLLMEAELHHDSAESIRRVRAAQRLKT